MSHNNGTALKQQFRVSCAMMGKTDPTFIRDQFVRAHGPDLIYDILKKAGYDEGDWVFKIVAKFKGSGRTPPLQIRRPENNGVHIWVKPGDNSTAVKGTLVVMKPLSPQEVYLKLREANAQEVALFKHPHEGTVVHVPPKLDEEEIYLLLDAVRETGRNWRGSMDEFILHVVDQLGERADAAYWLESAEELCGRQPPLLHDQRTHYVLTPAGQQLLNARLDGHIAPPNKEDAVSKDAVNAADIILKGRETLARLLAAADEIVKVRNQQADYLREIGEKEAELKRMVEEKEAELELLQEALGEVRSREAKLTEGIDAGALSALLWG